MTQDTDSDSDRLDLPDVAFPKWTSVAKLLGGLLLGYILYYGGVDIAAAVVDEIWKAAMKPPSFNIINPPDEAVGLVWKLVVLVAALTVSGVLFHVQEEGHRFRALDTALVGGTIFVAVVVNLLTSLDLLMFGLGDGLNVVSLLRDLFDIDSTMTVVALSVGALIVAYDGRLSTRTGVWTATRSFWIIGAQLRVINGLEWVVTDLARGEVFGALESVLSDIVSGGFEGLSVFAAVVVLLWTMKAVHERTRQTDPSRTIDVSPE